MRRLLFGMFIVPVLTVPLTAMISLSMLRDTPGDGNRQPPTVPRDPGTPDDILLENPGGLALGAGVWVTKAPLPLPSDAQMEELAKTNPLAFLKYCLRRYDATVQGYEVTLKKQERIGGKLLPTETITVQFREEPFSVLFEWTKGERLAKKTLYVRGENNDKLLVKPAGVLALAGVVEREPDGEQAKQSGRYPLTEFGIKIGTIRTVAAWTEARKNKALQVEYAGQKSIREVGDRMCYVLKRPRYAKPEEDGVSSGTFYFDKKTWLQVGTTLKNADGDLVAEYWFSDFKLNPELKPDTFTRKSLK